MTNTLDKKTIESLAKENARLKEEVSVLKNLLDSCLRVFDKVPTRAHIVRGVDVQLRAIALEVNSTDENKGLYVRINEALQSIKG